MNSNQMSLTIILPEALTFPTCWFFAAVHGTIIPLCVEMHVDVSGEVTLCGVSERANVTLEGSGVVEKMFTDWRGQYVEKTWVVRTCSLREWGRICCIQAKCRRLRSKSRTRTKQQMLGTLRWRLGRLTVTRFESARRARMVKLTGYGFRLA
jgi:hypothetical protein